MQIHPPIHFNTSHFVNHSHEYFAWMRANDPVCRVNFMRFYKAYLITRYDDVVSVMKDPRVFKNSNWAKQNGNSGVVWMPKNMRPLLKNMLNTDEPDHRRLRNLVHQAFTPKMIAELAPRIETITHELIDHIQKKGAFELMADFAFPLPIRVIAEIIGIPPEDHALFRQWTNAFVQNPTPINLLRAIPSVNQFFKYFRKLAEERRRAPRNDLITGLVQAQEGGDRFTEDELLAMVFLLLVAGHETTVNLITNGTYSLLTHPDQLDHLRRNPNLIESAIEEMLRFDGPLVTSEVAFAGEDITLHGTTIPKGALIFSALLSANRDEDAFPNADQFDITRSSNKHLAFGHGIHYCLGAPLARMEARIAFCALLERLPNLRLATKEVRFQNVMIVHKMEQLPLAC
ncbi:MAG: cytochrome P450 [Anaerolineales bacterium]